MKRNQLIQALTPALFAAAMLLGTSSVQAQVKIGTNPTTINAANNLEVEASSGGKTTSDKTSGQFAVTTTSDPVKFMGLQLSSDVNNKTLVVNPVNGVVKYAEVAPVKALCYQANTQEVFNNTAFGANSLTNPEIIDFAAADLVLNTGVASLAGNVFTIAEAGIYDVFAMSNIAIQFATWIPATAGYSGMAINLAIERQASGSSTWAAISGSRTDYQSDMFHAISCQTSSLSQLAVGDKIRVTIFRGAGNYITAGTASANAGVNGVPFSKTVKLVKIQ